MTSGYSYVLSEAASEFVFHLPGSEQLRVAAVFRQLAASPFRTGDYTTGDDRGRVLQNLLIDDWSSRFGRITR